MLKSFFMLAEVEPFKPETLPQHGGLIQKHTFNDIMMVGGIALGLALLLCLIVYMTRAKRRKTMMRSSRVLYREPAKSSDGSSGKMKLRKKRRSHPDNLPRNPTLGETGGLPPLRPEEPPEPVT